MKRSCKNIQKLIIEAESGASLTADLYRVIEEHVAGCPSCQAFQRDVILLLNSLKGRPLPSLSEGFFEEIRENVLTAMTSEKSHLPTLWERILDCFRGSFAWRPILVPTVTGTMGILIGILLATAWMRVIPPASHPRLALNQPTSISQKETAQAIFPTEEEAVPSIEEVEDYVDTEDIFDAMESRETQAFFSRWSQELPANLLEAPLGETG